MNYFISDLHLGHTNCLRFDNRPFKTVEEQDRKIIDNWNNTVKSTDDVYILGDISWYDTDKTIEIFKQLNGRLHLIKGNHDKLNKALKDLFCEVCDYKELFIDKKTSMFCLIIRYHVLKIITGAGIIYMVMYIMEWNIRLCSL